MTTKGNRIHVDIQSSFEMVDLVQVVFESLSAQVGFEDDVSHWMSVAIRESVTNAVRHGNKLDADKRVVIRFEVGEGELSVSVEDEGEGFDPDQVSDPLEQVNLLRPGGRGILFMKEFMDEIDYTFHVNGGTEVTLRKQVQGSIVPTYEEEGP